MVRVVDTMRKDRGMCRQVVQANRTLYKKCEEIRAVMTSMRLDWPFLQTPPLSPNVTAESCADKYDVCSLEYFLEDADTGDVLLFNSGGARRHDMIGLSVAGLEEAITCGHDSDEYAPYAAILQREFGGLRVKELADIWMRQKMEEQSSDEYDECFEWNHCGIIVNTPANKKFLVEAINPKVVVWRLDKAMESWLNHESRVGQRVAWRKLNVPHQLLRAHSTQPWLPGG